MEFNQNKLSSKKFDLDFDQYDGCEESLDENYEGEL